MAIAKQAGFTEQSFNACLSDQKMLDAIQAEQKRATEKFGVNSTPTLFVNGKMQRAACRSRTSPRSSIRCCRRADGRDLRISWPGRAFASAISTARGRAAAADAGRRFAVFR